MIPGTAAWWIAGRPCSWIASCRASARWNRAVSPSPALFPTGALAGLRLLRRLRRQPGRLGDRPDGLADQALFPLAPAGVGGLHRVPVHPALGQFAEELVGRLLLLERLLKELDGAFVPEGLRVAAERAVGGDLVVLDPLRGGDQARVEHLRRGGRRDQLLPLLDEPLHRRALLPAGPCADLLEDGVEPLDLLLGDGQVVLEGFAERG